MGQLRQPFPFATLHITAFVVHTLRLPSPRSWPCIDSRSPDSLGVMCHHWGFEYYLRARMITQLSVRRGSATCWLCKAGCGRHRSFGGGLGARSTKRFAHQFAAKVNAPAELSQVMCFSSAESWVQGKHPWCGPERGSSLDNVQACAPVHASRPPDFGHGSEAATVCRITGGGGGGGGLLARQE